MDTLGTVGHKSSKALKNIFQRPLKRGSSADGTLDTSSMTYSSVDSQSGATGAPAEPSVGPSVEWFLGGYYLHVLVREGRNLAVTEIDSMDPFVRVSVGDEATGLTQDATRVCYHNSDPMWEESLLFPLHLKTHDSKVTVAAYGRNDVKKPKFMGQTIFELGELLSSVKQLNEESVFWCPLSKRKPTDHVSGDICIAVSVVDQVRYMQLYHDVSHALDAASLHARLGGMMLQLALHDIRSLAASADRMGALSLEVRIGRSLVKKAIVLQEVADAFGVKSSVATLGDVILIPLHKAFKKGLGMAPPPAEERLSSQGPRQAPPLQRKRRNSLYGIQDMMSKVAQDMVDGATSIGKPGKPTKEKNEIADIKIYVKAGKDIVAKTQVPIWTVPTSVDDSLVTSSAPVAAASFTAAEALGKTASLQATVSKKVVDAQPASPPAPLGRRFARVMQNYRRDLMPPHVRLELAVSLQLQPKEGAPVALLETVEDSDLDEEEDISAPPPYVPPPDLELPMADAVLECGPNKLFRLMWKTDSEVLKKLNEIEKLKNVVISPFVVDPITKTKSRTTTYVKSLGVNLPFIPKEAECTTVMTVQAKEDGGWCVTQRVDTKAPQGDTFYILMQWAAVHQTANRTRLKVSMHLEFIKNVMTKGIIASQTTSGSRKAAELIIRLVKEHLDSSTPSAMVASPALLSPMTSSYLPVAAPVAQVSLPTATLAKVAVLLVALLALWHLTATITRSADHVCAALREVAEAVRSHPGRDVAEAVRQVLLQGSAQACAPAGTSTGSDAAPNGPAGP